MNYCVIYEDGEVVGWKPMTNPLDLKTLKELGFIK